LTISIAFLGGGNMAAALIAGLRAHRADELDLRVIEQDAARVQWLESRFGLQSLPPVQALAGADALVLAVKPQQLGEALQALHVDGRCTVISIAAGIRLASLRGWIGPSPPLVRSMPNTPALVGAGVSALYTPETTTPASRALAEAVLGSVGTTLWVDDEEALDAVTAVSGSGPAYFFRVVEAMAAAGRALGLDAETALTLARHTLIGSGRLAEADESPVAELRRRVTSPGGTTAAALDVLDQHGALDALFSQALAAAARRSRELGGS
jgi:pyrroline-5-carboxylate reductase (EC 1.5.1.2)